MAVEIHGFFKTGPYYTIRERRTRGYGKSSVVVEIGSVNPPPKRARKHKRASWIVIPTGEGDTLLVNGGHQYDVIIEGGPDGRLLRLDASDGEPRSYVLQGADSVAHVRVKGEDVDHAVLSDGTTDENED